MNRIACPTKIVTGVRSPSEYAQAESKVEEERRKAEEAQRQAEKKAEEERRQAAEAARDNLARELRRKFEGTFVSDWQPASFSNHKFEQVSLIIPAEGTIVVLKRFRDKPGGKVHFDTIPTLGWEPQYTTVDPVAKELVTVAPPMRFNLKEGGGILTVLMDEQIRRDCRFPPLFRDLKREK